MSSLTEHACLHPPILPHKPDAPKVHPHKWQCHLSNCQTRSWIRSSLPHTILQETSFCLPSRCILIRPCPHPHCHPPAPRPQHLLLGYCSSSWLEPLPRPPPGSSPSGQHGPVQTKSTHVTVCTLQELPSLYGVKPKASPGPPDPAWTLT